MRIGEPGLPVYDEKIKIKSLGEKELFKCIPYFSIKHGEFIRDYNYKLNFREDNKTKIICRHLAAQYALDVLNNIDRGKVEMSDFANPKNIRNHITSEVELYYQALIEKAQTVYLIDNNDFGRILVDVFKTMKNDGKTHRALFVTNYHHAMAVRLSTKRDNGFYYVVNFYDPTITDHTVRCKVDDLSLLETHTLKNYLNERDYYYYYPNNDLDITTILICENPNVLAVRQLNRDRKLTLINNPLPLVPSGRLLMALLIHNLPQEVIKVIGEIIVQPTLSPDDIYGIFNVCESDDIPIFYYALQRGEDLIVTALGQLIKFIPEGRRKEVLEAKAGCGVPGLLVAVHNGHAGSVKAYGKLLELIPENQRAELLDIKSPMAYPFFFEAITRGYKDTVMAFFELLKYVSPSEKEEFIAAKDKNGNSLLTLCLEQGWDIAKDTFNVVPDSVKNNSENAAGQD